MWLLREWECFVVHVSDLVLVPNRHSGARINGLSNVKLLVLLLVQTVRISIEDMILGPKAACQAEVLKCAKID